MTENEVTSKRRCHATGTWSGPATLELRPHVLAPLAALPVREVVSAMYIIADLSLGDAEVAYDYLAQHRARKTG